MRHAKIQEDNIRGILVKENKPLLPAFSQQHPIRVFTQERPDELSTQTVIIDIQNGVLMVVHWLILQEKTFPGNSRFPIQLCRIDS
jgi:hypothetical protein